MEGNTDASGGEYCRICRGEETHHKGDGVKVNVPNTVKIQERVGRGNGMDVIAVPYVFRYVSLSFLRWFPLDLYRVQFWFRALTPPCLFPCFFQLCAEMACMGIKVSVAVM